MVTHSSLTVLRSPVEVVLLPVVVVDLTVRKWLGDEVLACLNLASLMISFEHALSRLSHREVCGVCIGRCLYGMGL